MIRYPYNEKWKIEKCGCVSRRREWRLERDGVEQGSTGDGSAGEGDDLQVRRVLHEGVELPLVAYTRRNADLQG